MADKVQYYKLGGIATNFTDMGQPDPRNQSIPNNAVKALVLTQRVLRGLKHGAIVEASKEDYDHFQKTNKAQQEAHQDKVQKLKGDKVKSDNTKANKALQKEIDEANKRAEEAEEVNEELEKTNKELEAQITGDKDDDVKKPKTGVFTKTKELIGKS